MSDSCASSRVGSRVAASRIERQQSGRAKGIDQVVHPVFAVGERRELGPQHATTGHRPVVVDVDQAEEESAGDMLFRVGQLVEDLVGSTGDRRHRRRPAPGMRRVS